MAASPHSPPPSSYLFFSCGCLSLDLGSWLIRDDLVLRSFTSLHLQRCFPNKITFTGAAALDLVRPSWMPQLNPRHHLRRRGEWHEGHMNTEAMQLTRARCSLGVRRGSNCLPCTLTLSLHGNRCCYYTWSVDEETETCKPKPRASSHPASAEQSQQWRRAVCLSAESDLLSAGCWFSTPGGARPGR